MTENELRNIDRGATISCGPWQKVKLLGVCGKYVGMYNHIKGEKRVCIDVFLKFGKLG